MDAECENHDRVRRAALPCRLQSGGPKMVGARALAGLETVARCCTTLQRIGHPKATWGITGRESDDRCTCARSAADGRRRVLGGCHATQSRSEDHRRIRRRISCSWNTVPPAKPRCATRCVQWTRRSTSFSPPTPAFRSIQNSVSGGEGCRRPRRSSNREVVCWPECCDGLAIPRVVRRGPRLTTVAREAAGDDHFARLLGPRSVASPDSGATAAEGDGDGQDGRAHARCRARRAFSAGGRCERRSL